jgi:DNA-binding transcriptional MerR regulator
VIRITPAHAFTALRHYEKLGILPTSKRTNGGYRIFPTTAAERVQLAQGALQLGFSLSELSEILRIRDDGGVPCHRVLRLTEEKLRSLGQQIEELQRTQAYMWRLGRDLNLERRELQQLVIKLTGRLPRSQRATLQLRVWGDLSIQELASVQGVPVGTN